MTNHQLALAAAIAAAFINALIYGNLAAAILGAGTLTYVMSRILSWGIDKFHEYRAK